MDPLALGFIFGYLAGSLVTFLALLVTSDSWRHEAPHLYSFEDELAALDPDEQAAEPGVVRGVAQASVLCDNCGALVCPGEPYRRLVSERDPWLYCGKRCVQD